MSEFKFTTIHQRKNDILTVLKQIEFLEPLYVCTKENGDIIIHFKEQLSKLDKTVLKEIVETITDLRLET